MENERINREIFKLKSVEINSLITDGKHDIPVPANLSQDLINSGSDYVQLGHKYRKGDGVKQDHQEAFRFYQLAASQGDSEGEAWLAYVYLQGEGGVIKNDTEALRLSKLGVEKENPFAYRNLGYCYCYGRGTDKDTEEGIKFLQKGVELGNSYAQASLGCCYENGIGVKKNLKEAVHLYRLAAEQGNAGAQKGLGYCYINGIGVEKNYKEAVRLYQLAADQGHAVAQNNLAHCYYSGTGVEQNFKEAVRLYTLAVNQGEFRTGQFSRLL